MKLSTKNLALAMAVLWGGAIFFVGLIHMAVPTYGDAFLRGVSSIYPGYNAGTSFGSVIVGTIYALIDGAVGGFLLGWLYNLMEPKPRVQPQQQQRAA